MTVAKAPNIDDAPTSPRTKTQHDLVSRILPILTIWDPEGLEGAWDPKERGNEDIGICDCSVFGEIGAHHSDCAALIENEPMGLAYAREAEWIAGSVYRIHSIETATQNICDVFNNSFGPLFGLKPGVPPGPNEGYRVDGYDGARIVIAGWAVWRAVQDHRAWFEEATAERRARGRVHLEGLLAKYGMEVAEGETGEAEEEIEEFVRAEVRAERYEEANAGIESMTLVELCTRLAEMGTPDDAEMDRAEMWKDG